jgi:hypothetical protein
MTNRRKVIKTIGVYSAFSFVGASNVFKLGISSPIDESFGKINTLVIGSNEWSKYYKSYFLHHNNKYNVIDEIICNECNFPMSLTFKDGLLNTVKNKLSSHKKIDLIVIAGYRKPLDITMEAISAGASKVWVDRPIVHSKDEAYQFTAFISDYDAAVQIAHVNGKELYLSEIV